MKIKNQLEEVLSQDMDRREFFSYIGVVLLGIFGISNIMKVLGSSHKQSTTQTRGYSSGSYGGK